MYDQFLDTRQLLAFRTLAECGSFTKAAKKLSLTQSAISHSIRGLEGSLDCRLFERLGKRVHLTFVGEQFLAKIQVILEQMAEARKTIDDASSWGKGRLRIGASTSACQYILPSVLREFKECFPECTVAIIPGDTPELGQGLLANHLDLAISLSPQFDEPLDFHPLFEDELSLVLSPSMYYSREEAIDHEILSNESFILYNKRSYTFGLILKYLRASGIEMRNTIELGSMEAIKELVKIGMGVSVLASWVVRKELEEESLISRPISAGKLKRLWGISYAKGRRLNLMEETFLGLCEGVCSGLVSEGPLPEGLDREEQLEAL